MNYTLLMYVYHLSPWTKKNGRASLIVEEAYEN